jgi:hypothetical protein
MLCEDCLILQIVWWPPALKQEQIADRLRRCNVRAAVDAIVLAFPIRATWSASTCRSIYRKKS